MDRNELKRRWILAQIQPELFYIPFNNTGHFIPLIYRVVRQEITVSFDHGYNDYEYEDYEYESVVYENAVITDKYIPSKINIKIDWGDGSWESLKRDYEEQQYDDPYPLTLTHEYDDGEEEHIVKIYGRCSQLMLDGYAVEIIQWGDLNLKSTYNMLAGSIHDGDQFANGGGSYESLIIPETPITGMEHVKYAYRMFAYTGIESIPDELFTEMTDLADVRYMFDYCWNLKYIGNGIFKGLKKLHNIYDVFSSHMYSLISIGDSTFEGCEGLGYYGVNKNSNSYDNIPWEYWVRENFRYVDKVDEFASALPNSNYTTYIRRPSRFTTLGSYTFKDCVNLDFWNGKISTLHTGYMFEDVSICRPKTIGNGTFENCTELKDTSHMFQFSSFMRIPADTFKNCINIENVTWLFGEMRTPVWLEDGLLSNTTKITSIDRVCSSTPLLHIPTAWFGANKIKSAAWAFYVGDVRRKHSLTVIINNQTVTLTNTGATAFYISGYAQIENTDFESIEEVKRYFEYNVKNINLNISNVFNVNNVTSDEGDFHGCFYDGTDFRDDNNQRYGGVYTGMMPPIWTKQNPNFESYAYNGFSIGNIDAIPHYPNYGWQCLGYGNDTTQSNSEFISQFGKSIFKYP